MNRRGILGADHRDFVDGAEPEIEGDEHLPGAHRRVGHEAAVGLQRLLGFGRVLGSPREIAQAKQGGRGHRVATGHGAVLQILGPRDQCFVVVGGVKESAGGVVEAVVQHVGEFRGRNNPSRVEGRFVQAHERVDEVGIVFEIGRELRRLTDTAGAQQPAVGGAHFGHHEVGGPDGGCDVLRFVESRAGLGEGGNRQPVPRGQDLLVAAGPDSLRPNGVEFRLDLFELRLERGQVELLALGVLLVAACAAGDVVPLEVAAGAHAVNRFGEP